MRKLSVLSVTGQSKLIMNLYSKNDEAVEKKKESTGNKAST